jgi:hypothetical protein
MPQDFSGQVIQSFGTFVYNMVELKSGDSVIERVYSDNAYISNELNVPLGKRPGLQSIVGNLTQRSDPLPVYYVYMPFTVKMPTNVPLAIHVLLEDPSLIMDIPYTKTVQMDTVIEYVYTVEPIPRHMQFTTIYYQKLQFIIKRNSESHIKITTSFMNNVRELFWLVGRVPYNNDIIDLSLSFNNIEYLSNTISNNAYLRIIQPYEYHTRVSDSKIYSYSFSLDPVESIPNGEINMTNIPTQTHLINVIPFYEPRTITIYAETFNVCTINDGVLTMMYNPDECSGFKN